MIHGAAAWEELHFVTGQACFEAGTIRELLGLILCGEKVVLATKDKVAWLPIVWEALLALLGPFEWPFVYAPMLPAEALGMLDAPHPFLVGIFQPNRGDFEQTLKTVPYPIDVHCYWMVGM